MIRLLFHDEHLFAVYKPAGLHSVQLPDGGGGESLADLLLDRFPSLATVAKSSHDAGLISRLDRDTSGVILGAFSQPLWEQLYRALLTGEIDKTYVALVEGALLEPRSFSSYIGSPHRGARKVKIYEQRPAKSARALPGTTHFAPLCHNATSAASLATIKAAPARRHQVRAHAGYIGYPLIGDSLYGSTRSVAQFVSAQRSFLLHATRITFRHPISGEAVVIDSPVAEELSPAMQPLLSPSGSYL